MLINHLKIKQLFCIAFFVLAVNHLYAQEKTKLVILHTNDTHSQVEATDMTAPRPDMGGYARRMGIIEQIRKEEAQVLLVDAGDYWQGTPYFNFFNGRIEIDAMNRMKYDAATLGNHEFDNGVDTLAAVLSMAEFPVLCSNYDVSATQLSGMLKPYLLVEKGGVKIGLFALCINPQGLIMAANYRGIIYNDPLQTAVEMSSFLKKDKKCDVIVCLSHLGVAKHAVNDFDIARATQFVDVIIGGHSHELIENTTEPNAGGKPVVIAQMGKSGLYLGRIDLWLEK
ncbi:MAG: metallophosphatase [Prevotellaceae bacterium]|jgi:5'-nucleotidase|nr:metallophosphatase [Prevotellaceae bacterium]